MMATVEELATEAGTSEETSERTIFSEEERESMLDEAIEETILESNGIIEMMQEAIEEERISLEMMQAAIEA